MANAAIDRKGVVQDELTGEKFIPASQRPDGTWRKARRVKEGYIPQDEMPAYENKGVQWMKSRSNLPPGLNPADVEKSKVKQQGSQEIPGLPMSKAAKKNMKRKEKKKEKAQEEQGSKVEKMTYSMAEASITDKKSGDKKSDGKQENSASGDTQQDMVKKVRNLKKKLKQIEDLEAKIKSGEIKNPEKEQLEKVSKKKTLMSEIEELEKSL